MAFAKFFYLVIFSIIVLLNCSNKDDSNRIIHPTEENLNPEFGITNTIGLKDTVFQMDKVNTEIENLAERLQNHDIVLSIGKKEGEPYEMFGEIAGADIPSDSVILISDSQNISIYYFNEKGEHRQTFAEAGRGPGEMTNGGPIQIHQSDLFALDQFFHINRYVMDNKRFEYAETLELEFVPSGFCITDDHLIVQSMFMTSPENIQEASNIFLYKTDNYKKPVSSFGKYYKAKSPSAVLSLSVGGLTCHKSSDLIISYFNFLNLIYGYDKNGNLIWITRIKDFELLRFVETPRNTGPDQVNMQDHFDVIENAVFIDNNFVLIQIKQRSLNRDLLPDPKLSSYLISVDTGNGIYLGKNLKKMLTVSENKLALFDDEQFPRVLIANF